MNLVIDTNIVFSSLLNPKSTIGDLLLNYQNEIVYYAPEFLLTEIEKYSDKIATYSKLNKDQLSICKKLVLNSVIFISEELISEENWQKAFELTNNIDEKDTPFVALALELKTKLWTGDKKLSKGLIQKNSEIIVTTTELTEFINTKL